MSNSVIIKKLISVSAFCCVCVLTFQNCSRTFEGSSADTTSISTSSLVDSNSFQPSSSVPPLQSISRFEFLAVSSDLLQEELDRSMIKDIPADVKTGGFESAASQSYDQNFIQSRLDFATLVAEKAIRSKKVIFCSLQNSAQAPWDNCVQDIVVKFAQKAFRRPIENREIAILKNIFQTHSQTVISDLAALAAVANPIGSLDFVDSSLVVAGWSLDPLWDERSVEIHFYIDGPAGIGNIIGNTFANLPRPDVNQYYSNEGYKGDHGFNFQIPSRYADGADHVVYAYAIGGVNPLLGQFSFNISPQQFGGVGAPAPVPQLSSASEEAFKNTFIAVLLSPSTQLRRMKKPAEMSIDKEIQFRLAQQLSWFISGSSPDPNTMRLAEEGKLTSPDLYRNEVSRLIDKNSQKFSYQVFGQWMGFRDFSMKQNLSEIEKAMVQESTLVFKELIDKNMPVTAILEPGFTFVNKTLAEHYQIPIGPSSESFSKIVQSDRGGVLSQGSILRQTAPNNETKPTLRGKWVQWNLLCRPIPSPSPEDFQKIAEAQQNADPNWSVSERLEQHRKVGPSCFSCHQYMDPLGLALENYGPLGVWRNKYPDGKNVESSGTLDGVSFSGTNELIAIVKKRKDFRECVVTKLLSHAISRPLSIDDLPFIQETASKNLKIKDLIQAIAESPNFLFSAKPEEP